MKLKTLISIFSHQRFLAFMAYIAFACTADGQDEGRIVSALDESLRSRETTVDQVLTDKKYLSLRYDAGFRELIRQYAPKGAISIVPSAEPGDRITVKGQMVRKGDGQPVANSLFYFYQTMSTGYYSENNNSNENPKLFGYMFTDRDGRFEIHTIKPGGYPEGRGPSHIHVEVYGKDGNKMLETEFQFYDDPRMSKEVETASLRHGSLIAKNTGSAEKPLYYYKVEVP